MCISFILLDLEVLNNRNNDKEEKEEDEEES